MGASIRTATRLGAVLVVCAVVTLAVGLGLRLLARRGQPQAPGTAGGVRAADSRPSPQEPAVLYEARADEFRWLASVDRGDLLGNRIPPPPGFARTPAAAGTFAHWLRRLPLKPGRPPVLLFDGRPKGNQDAHAAVVNMDIGTRDLQQCADAVIRLRAEYLFASARHEAIRFHFTSGDRADWADWAAGMRPAVTGNSVRWRRSAPADASYPNFRKYLDAVFTYAGTLSLGRELEPVPDAAAMQIGDVFVQGGSPGHAVLVVDMTANAETGATVFLLAQGYMPAQEIHVLRNPNDAARSPWYDLRFGDTLRTPEWTFRRQDLKRFP